MKKDKSGDTAKGPTIAVSDAYGVRSLHVGGEAIQSSMKLGDPFSLALDYTRCMMGFLLFHPQPREALMIGLGGGSLAKFFHRKLRPTRLRDLDPFLRLFLIEEILLELSICVGFTEIR